MQTEHYYIVREEAILSGEPIIRGTRTPVRAIVESWRMGISPEEIRQGMPHLTLGQVFDALSFYCDHPEEINGYIQKNRIPETRQKCARRALVLPRKKNRKPEIP